MLAFLLPSLAALAISGPVQSASSVDRLSWLSGHWTFERDGRTVEEHWTKPAGGTVIGMGRTVRDGKNVEHEFLLVRQEGGELHYVAKPSRRAETVFKLTKLTDTEALFENPQHDFPTRVLYRRQPDGSLHARIEGVVNGRPRAIEYPYRRAKCD